MTTTISTSYSQFYKGTDQIKSYGAAPGKGDALARYESNTADNQGDKTTGKMTKEVKTTSAESIVNGSKDANTQLSNLANKFKGYNFFAVNFSKGMRYGSLSTTNVAISPEFLKKMANDPELAQKYETEIANMKKLDQQRINAHEMNGRRMVAHGWAIDKNGGISSWSISEPTDKRHHMQEMNDYINDIRQKKAEAKQKQAKASKPAQRTAFHNARTTSEINTETLKKKVDFYA